MGLVDGSAIAPLHVDTSPLPQECGATIANYFTVTIGDIQARHGPRVPGPDSAQRSFNILFAAESHERMLSATELTFYEILAAHYVKPVPAGDPDPYHRFNWVPVTRYFGEDVAWNVVPPAAFYTVAPCRLIDTRGPDGPLAGPALVAGVDRTFPIVGKCDIPSGAKAVSVNMAVTGASAAGNLRLHPGATPVPLVSSISYSPGQTRSNNAIVPLSSAGQLAVFAGQASGTVHFILDVNGYFQ